MVGVADTNAAGSTSATSAATSLVGALLPSNTSLPSISGVLKDGQLLTATTGSGTGTERIKYTYQWQLCSATGGSCGSISEALVSTLTLAPGDVGSTLRVVVTATNAAGSTSATSAATSLVAAILPSNTALPSISGVLQDGQLLTASNGSWTGTEPIKYTYQWQLCNATGGSCGEISEALAPTLKPSGPDSGSTLRVFVT